MHLCNEEAKVKKKSESHLGLQLAPSWDAQPCLRKKISITSQLPLSLMIALIVTLKMMVLPKITSFFNLDSNSSSYSFV